MVKHYLEFLATCLPVTASSMFYFQASFLNAVLELQQKLASATTQKFYLFKVMLDRRKTNDYYSKIKANQ